MHTSITVGLTTCQWQSLEYIAEDPKDWFISQYVMNKDYYHHSNQRIQILLNDDFILNSPVNNTIDTVCLAKAIKLNIKKSNSTDLLSWLYRLLNHREKGLKTNLQQCCKDYDIDFDPSKLHDAMYDIEKNMNVFQKLMWEVEV